ncbi:aminotransferase-like domain-containing protein [Hymenobacter rubripertinctus]|uniref:PLP-dependent aminotransferase family protein n=1 Tax=Hymenobacter rubripertinctus TaxID=2029981 RepID=A0A418QJN1_9BACT|nr:PLP-dependent aminotransferase family protein [Hymenobacter rubripertinctus]RIY05375.1 PLP-dependent aminotransferase family protein [Hymenobacter rubripertinctus]
MIVPTPIDTLMLNPLLDTLAEDVMGFLNEIQLNYPQALSLASGRPDENYFNIEEFPDYFGIYVDWLATASGQNPEKVRKSLGQYNRAKGIINDLVVRYLAKDEQIKVAPEDTLITVGTQEAMVITITTLCNRDNDVILIEDPAYVGISHLAIIAGYQVAPVPVGEQGISLPKLEEKILACQAQGKTVKLVYVIPDYQNPTGNAMPIENRRRLLQLADTYGFLILEDNAYGEFAYQANSPLTLKALDVNKRVIYLRSLSKTLYPSLRLGVLVADQQIEHGGKLTALSDLLAKTKGYITVNTPSITQAVFGGILVKNNFSLKKINAPKIAAIKAKRDQLLASLNENLTGENNAWARDISWSTPQGGFFLTVSVPFTVAKEEVIICAENHGMIFTPMSFFYLSKGGGQQIRLAFSNVSKEEIKDAVHRLASYFKTKINLTK